MGRIVEVRTVGSYQEANSLVAEGWELYAILAATGGENLWGYHLVRRSSTALPEMLD